MPSINPDLLEDYRQALQNLYDQLSQAFPVAATVEAKDAIRDLAESVFDILTVLNQADIASNKSQYAAVKADIGGVNRRLRQVQGRLDDWIHVVSVSAQIGDAIDKAIDLASRVLAC